MKTLTFLLITLISFYSCAEKENSNPLKDLRILSAAEQENKSIRLTSTIPSYTESGEPVAKKEWGKFMDIDQYERVLYTDSSNEIKAIVFKKSRAIKPVSKPVIIKEDSEALIGKPAKNFIGKDLNGNVVELEKLKGKIVVLNFWFTECKPCILEMKDLNALKEKYNNSIAFLGVTFDEPGKITAFLKSTPFHYTILPDASTVCKDWGVIGYPTNMVIDKAGRVQYVKVGLDRNIHTKLDSVIQRMM